MLLLGAVAHHPLDVRAVVPAAVEQDHLPGGRQVLDVPLEVPLRLLALGRHGSATTRTVRGLVRSVIRLITPPLPAEPRPSKITGDLEPLGGDPVLQQHQLLLEPGHLRLVHDGRAAALGVVRRGRGRTAAGHDDVVGALGAARSAPACPQPGGSRTAVKRCAARGFRAGPVGRMIVGGGTRHGTVQKGRFTADVDSLGEEVVVFLIGMRINKPLKVRAWWPVFVAMPKMLKVPFRSTREGAAGLRAGHSPVADDRAVLALVR